MIQIITFSLYGAVSSMPNRGPLPRGQGLAAAEISCSPLKLSDIRSSSLLGFSTLFAMADEEPVDPKKYLEEACKPKCVKQLRSYEACVKRIQGDESGNKHCTGRLVLKKAFPTLLKGNEWFSFDSVSAGKLGLYD
ncbi:hypothetical protein DITRI_Ditri08aG0150600 [Diplodiscus trichospermus]